MRIWPVALGVPAILAIIWTAAQDWLPAGEPTMAHEYTILALGVPQLVILATRLMRRRLEAIRVNDSRRSRSGSWRT
ncbi:MAG: hypothetical protein QGI83_14345 [Candidatus Latescibacteria bacterium]|jgi:sorbitol-specific phosphotransferase system component IIBC|nr:hypothetical protein [Candidatus Latescibacterota bacterium]